MRNETRQAFNRYLERQAELNAVDASTVRAGQKFNVTPSVQQKLETKQQESSAFLQGINIVPVTEMEGEKLGLGVSGPIASRTDTAIHDRMPKDPTGLDSRGYKCVQTNSDTYLTYGKLDMWAKFPDFQTRIRDAIVKRQALDRIMIGFNGVSIAAETDLVANPLLQDVNKGWLQQLRETSAERVMAHGQAAGAVSVGENGDYANLDAVVFDAKYSLLPSWAREDSELVAIVGSDLLHDKYFSMVNVKEAPTEQVARDVIMSKNQIGGLQAARVPFFPANAILITRFDNLSIYFQDGKRRRTIVDNAKRDRVENYESSNDAYVFEDTDYACLVENIAIGDVAAAPAGA